MVKALNLNGKRNDTPYKINNIYSKRYSFLFNFFKFVIFEMSAFSTDDDTL